MKWRAGTETASGIQVVPEPIRSMEMPRGIPIALALSPIAIPAMDVSVGGRTCATAPWNGANMASTRSVIDARRNICMCQLKLRTRRADQRIP